MARSRNIVYIGDNLPILKRMKPRCAHLVYVDPPFNTGTRQARALLKTVRCAEGDRTGFGGRRYATRRMAQRDFADRFDDYIGFLEPRLRQAHRLLTPHGALYLHLDYREVHYAKILLDDIFGRECFLNEIIWAYDYGARSRTRWPAKHDNILFYVKDPKEYTFNAEAVDRIPYMAPGLVTPEKAKRGKLPTDTWWHTIVSPTGKEKTGYPTQKPLGIMRRIIAASSNPGDTVLDFFAGSGTAGVAAHELGRRFILVDSSPQAACVMRDRLRGMNVRFVDRRGG